MTDIERQVKLEADAVQDGNLRYKQSREYQLATDTRPVRDLMVNSLKSLADAILAEQLALKTSERLPKYGTALLSVHHEKLALITLGTLLNGISRSEFEEGLEPPITPVAYEIGQWCRVERIRDCLLQREVDVANKLLPRNRSRHARRRAEELARKLDDQDDWAKNFRSYHLGEKLIALAVKFAYFDGQPVFELRTAREGYDKRTKTTHKIGLTTAAGEWLDSHEAALASLPSPVYRPMIVPPRPWTSLSGGGYLITPLNLLKRKANRRAKQLLKTADLSIVYSAVNALQNTPYRINKDIYRTVRTAWDAGNLVFGLRTHVPEQLPPRLPDDADSAEIEERKQQRADAFIRNTRIKGSKKVLALRLSVCEQFFDEPRIFFPHQLDHRGRAYPVPQLVNPQQDDIGRALLEFADGKPLGERGPYWLAIHIANCYGKNKVSFDQRLAWVHQHEQEILASAYDPMSIYRFWGEADKPFNFLAACKEWKGYQEEGPGFLSHLPVSMDGTCNGYQHLSALGRDPVGGRATNLVPGEAPADIYQEVADAVSRRIASDAENAIASAKDVARQLLKKIDRSVVKHATMTTPYGVTIGTIYRQLRETSPAKDCRDPEKCARYLAKVIVECIPEVAVEAGNTMKWLRDVARTLAMANRGMMWTTPAGFLVGHAIREPKTQRIATADRTLLLYEEDETRMIDPRKQADGIVAHLVHSMDAAHMMWTIHRLYNEGLRHFAMVHDSFGVHACDVDLLNRILREEFVRIYSEPVMLRFFKEQWEANPGVPLPALPALGTLDIR